jgi:hypothetical protein
MSQLSPSTTSLNILAKPPPRLMLFLKLAVQSNNAHIGCGSWCDNALRSPRSMSYLAGQPGCRCT